MTCVRIVPRLLVLVAVICVFATCAVRTKAPRMKDGKVYGVSSGYIWRSTWWNYYARGVSFAEGDFWEDAIEDLTQAIELRDEDRRRARTYGMHFIDYFPHRELGIIYYRQEKYPQAIVELERSLASDVSAKAEYYLNRARKAWLERTGADRTPPTIDISWPVDNSLTRDLTIEIKGIVSDDQFVFGISVMGKAIPVLLAEKAIPFSFTVPLNSGTNSIEIVAHDLMGKEATASITILADWAGPVLFLDPVRVKDQARGTTYVVSGEAVDGVGLAEISIQGVSVKEALGKRYRFEKELTVHPVEKLIQVVARDLAGNVTHGTLSVPEMAATPHPPRIQLAFLDQAVSDCGYCLSGSTSVKGDRFADEPSPARIAQSLTLAGPLCEHDSSTGAGPLICFKDLSDALTVYYESLYVEGNVSGPEPIKSIFINGVQLLDRVGRNVFFSYLVGLDEGHNAIEVRAEDSKGYEATKAIAVVRKIPRIWSLSERLRLALVPFHPSGCSKENARLIADDLLSALIRQKRFHMVERERLEEILTEQRLSSSGIADDKTAVRVGHMVAAEGIVTGNVVMSPRAIEVVARIVDTEKSQDLLIKDAFTEDTSLEGILSMVEGLAYKFRQGLPLLEGSVLPRENDDLYLNIGGKDGVIPAQKVIVFREGPEIRHPTTHLFLGREIEIVAEGRIQEVCDTMSSVLITRKRAADCTIDDSSLVVTK